jgi:DNA topoisomerase-3
MYRPYLKRILETESYKKIAKTRYTDDKAITDHYAIIPTGQGLNALPSLKETTARVYELICRRFLAIFYPPAIFDKISLEIRLGTEMFSASFKTCVDPGYLEVMDYSFRKKKEDTAEEPQQKDGEGNEQETDKVPAFVSSLRKSMKMNCTGLEIKEGETKPPKRYNSGSMILAMENAGQLIEEEELREQIRGSGIGTSATRAEILKKLFSNRYLALNKKTQVITPTLMGEMIYDTVDCSIRSLLNPKLTASWELGLTRVSEGSVSEEEYLDKLNGFVSRNTNNVKNSNFSDVLQQMYMRDSQFYKKPYAPAAGGRKKTGRKGN